jgi:predicted HTH domain antitoxin
MNTLTAQELEKQPLRLVQDAQRGESSVITADGQPILVSVPLVAPGASQRLRLEAAVDLFERGEVSLGLAARISGLSYSRLIDELAHRGIPVVRYGADELDAELAYVRSLAGGR